MPRSRRRDESWTDELLALLTIAPWWVGPLLAGVAFCLFRWMIPVMMGGSGSSEDINKSLSGPFRHFVFSAAPWVAGFILVVWIAAETVKYSRRRLVDTQTGAESIQRLSWQQFEGLLGEAFRRQGFQVEFGGGAAPDGGIDLELDKAGARTLVQCKHWKDRSVGVRVVRELLGVVTSRGAQSGIVVTSGDFSEEARRFANSTVIRLIDGAELVSMISSVQKSKSIESTATSPRSSSREAITPGQSSTDVACPVCGAPMKVRLAKKGANAGSQFLGCSRYPECRGTRNL